MNAGLKSMYSKSCSGGSLIQEILNGGEMWMCNDTGAQSAKPGDVLVRAKSTVSESQMGSFIDTEHAMIYVGDGKIIHAKGKKYGIVHEELGSRLTDGRNFFVRPADLIEADKQAAQMGSGSTGSVTVENGTIDGQNYVAKIPGAVCTSYYGDGSSASGMPLVNGSVCASHNLPYGTKIYIPSLKDLPGKGIVTVVDTGGPLFDFDIYSSSSLGKEARDAYVLEWGTGKISWSYTEAIDFYVKKGTWNTYTSAWNMYKNMGGKLIGFLKFSDKDQDIKNHPQYNS
jgi:3D (Asp-Asp-Asp) domain-containing protein